MASAQTIREGQEFLNSWKDIANYMGRGVRTVQRYEVSYGLPVRRPAGKSRSSVMATRSEIDAWVAASPIRESYELPKRQANGRSAEKLLLQEGLHEMRKLREQMMELRAEIHLSLNLFVSSLGNLTKAMNTAQASGSLGVIGHSSAAGDHLWMGEPCGDSPVGHKRGLAQAATPEN